MNHTKSKSFKSEKPDPFFSGDLRKHEEDDDSIQSSDSDEYGDGGVTEAEEELTAAEKRKRMAEAFLKKMKAAAAAAEDGEDVDERGGLEARVLEVLNEKQLEERGRVRKAGAAR